MERTYYVRTSEGKEILYKSEHRAGSKENTADAAWALGWRYGYAVAREDITDIHLANRWDEANLPLPR